MWLMVVTSLDVDCLWARDGTEFPSVLAHREPISKEKTQFATLCTLSHDDGLYVSPKHIRQMHKMK
jgi:hypothetical protein